MEETNPQIQNTQDKANSPTQDSSQPAFPTDQPIPKPPELIKPKKNFKFLLIIIPFLLLAGGLGYFALQNYQLKKSVPQETPTLSTPSPSNTPLPSINIPAGWEKYSHDLSGLTLAYPPGWNITEEILKKGDVRNVQNKFSLDADDNDLYIITLSNQNSWQIEIVLDLVYQQQLMPGAGPIDFVAEKFKELEIDERKALRSKIEDGFAVFGGMIPREPYPISILFRRIQGEGIATWPNPDTDTSLVLLFSAQNPNKTVSYSITYYSPEFTKNNIDNRKINKNILNEMDQVLSTFKFLDPSETDQPIVTAPLPNSKITSPVIIKGAVPAGWMFEGVFPIKLVDDKKNLIVQAQGKQTPPGDWTNGKPVEFTAALSFTTTTKSGYIILEKDNPSGLPQNAKTFEVPINF